MSSCYAHLDVPAVATCLDCNSGLCSGCKREALGRSFCQECLEQRLGTSVRTGEPLKRPWLATVLSLFVPGLGQVYNGLVTRGLAQFGLVFFFVWLTDLVDNLGPLVGILLVITWVWQILDARGTARDINRTGRLPDVEEARAVGALPLPAGLSTPSSLGIALIVFGALALLSSVASVSRVLVPLAFIGGGAWLWWRSRAQHDAVHRGPDQPPPPPAGY